MNTYEVLVIFKPIVDVENVENTLNQFQNNIVQAHGGEIVDSDRIGRKRLAYDIKKFKDGFLALYLLKFPPEKIADFKKACEYSEDVLRLTLIRRKDNAVLRKRHDRFRGDREEGGRPEGDRPFRGGGRGGFRGGDRGGFRGGDRFDRGGDRGDRGERPPVAAQSE